MMNHNVIYNQSLLFQNAHLVLESLLKIIPINFLWCNEEGYVIGCNENYVKFFNDHDSIHDLIGKNLKDFGSFAAWENTQKVIETGKSLLIEETHITNSGKKIYFLSMKSPIVKNNKIVGAVIIAIDITDRKLMEFELTKAKEKSEIAHKAKSAFLDNIRHDIRTPFSGILSVAQFLGEGETDPIKKSFLKDIEESSQSLLNYLNEMLDYLKTESGKLPILEKEFDTYDVLDSVYKMMLPFSKNKQLDFKLIIDENLPKYLIGDATRTQRILINLLSNAVKFTEKGFVKLFVYFNFISDTKCTLEFIVEDTGIGIPQDQHDMVFERFNRLTSSYSGVYPGKGLGINLVKQYLDELDGQIFLESEVGKGTKFKAVVPYKIPLLRRR